MKGKLIYNHQKTELKNIALALLVTIATMVVSKYIFLPIYYKIYYGSLGSFLKSIARNINNAKQSILMYFREEFLYMFLIVIIFVVWYIIITRKRAMQLYEIMNVAENMANGEEYKKLNGNIKGDIGELSRNINFMVESLQNSLDEQRILEKTKTDLITNVSHDLRTPLTSILGYLSIIDEDRYKDEVELRYYVNIAYEKAKGLNILINDLFELTRMRSAKININKEEIDICELIGQVSAQFYLQLKNNNMEINLNIPEDKIMVYVDSLKIVRALENLIINAINYSKGEKYIDIYLDIIEIEEKIFIEIIVENYGEISQVDIPYIFDRFYRVEKSRALATGGSGLGLAITKSIINLHEGEIFVHSDMGKTRFQIHIPRDL